MTPRSAPQSLAGWSIEGTAGWWEISRTDPPAEVEFAEIARAARAEGVDLRSRIDGEDLPAYQRAGFRPVGVVPGFPPGRTEITAVLRHRGAGVDDGGIHPVKLERYDVPGRTHIDAKGIARPLEDVRTEDFGLYTYRTADARAFDALESWVLPAVGLRATIFRFRPGHEHEQRVYLDVGDFRHVGAGQWEARDFYLDILELPGSAPRIIDTDEFVAAIGAGLINPDDAVRALDISSRAMAGIGLHGGSVDAWLAATVGIELRWPRLGG